MHVNSKLIGISALMYITFVVASCKKLIEIDPPIDTITTGQVFTSDKQAEWAIAGVYSRMINGNDGLNINTRECFAAGLSNMASALSSDELINVNGVSEASVYVLAANSLSVQNSAFVNKIWESGYKTIYDANGVIEGISESTSVSLTDSVRKQLTAEAKAIRAFAYFYLTNTYGDLPLVLTIDFNQTKNLQRSPKSKIYEQIVKDLTDAKAGISDDFSVGKGERIRINKWFVEAFLARVYLYLGQYELAINSATAVINKSDLFMLETDLSRVFLANNNEAIWQLRHHSDVGESGTPEGKLLLPMSEFHMPWLSCSDNLMEKFEDADQRKTNWISITQLNPADPITYYPAKYKTGRTPGAITEYYTIMRLAEMYLIRAEASALLSGVSTSAIIDDLNMLRQRAGVEDLPYSLSFDEVITAIADERMRELFCEGSHRWFDLKRTGKATEVLSAVPYKSPWKGDFQLLYPIPVEEIKINPLLSQNPQYNNF